MNTKNTLKTGIMLLLSTALIVTASAHAPEYHNSSEEASTEADDYTVLQPVYDAVEESNLSILVILLTFTIMLTSIYFIVKLLLEEWRWIEYGS